MYFTLLHTVWFINSLYRLTLYTHGQTACKKVRVPVQWVFSGLSYSPAARVV
jgi:hypothetical protein